MKKRGDLLLGFKSNEVASGLFIDDYSRPLFQKKIASARVQRRPSFLRAGYSPVQPFRTTLDGIRRLSGRSFGSLRFLGYDSGRDVLHKKSHTKNSSVFFGHRWNKLVAFRPQNPKNS